METPGNITYQAAAAANVVVATSYALLERIIIGADVASGVIEISDSASDGDGDVKVYLAGSTLMTSTGGSVEINAVFPSGIAADLTNQTNVSFVWRPLPHAIS